MTINLDPDKEWLADVRRLSSPNCDDRPDHCAFDLVVIHNISLPPGEYGGVYIDHLFTNCLDEKAHPFFSEIKHLRVSSHLLIDRTGNITQYVPFNSRAWHAGESEFCGRQTCNDFSIGIELEGTDEEPYETCQYEAAAEVVGVLMRNWPAITRDRIVGHSDISPGRKTDPGPAFDWQFFHALLDKR